jgi:hypothetical protein
MPEFSRRDSVASSGERGYVVIVEELPGVCTAGYDPQERTVVMTWLKNDDTAFRPMLEIQLRTITERQAATVIVDTRRIVVRHRRVRLAGRGQDAGCRLRRARVVADPLQATSLESGRFRINL